MKPIALSSPDGKVYAYACSLCHHVGDSGSLLVAPRTGPIARLVEASLIDATRCCSCFECGRRVKRGTRDVTCERCRLWRAFTWIWVNVATCIQRGIESQEALDRYQWEDDDDVG